MAAPSSTPLTGPDPSTPSSAAMATKNSVRLKCQMWRSARMSTQAHHRGEHDGREHGLRQVAQQAGREEHDDQREQRGDQARHRRACPGALVDQRLRHAAAHRKAAAEPRQEIRGAERQQLLVGVEPIAVLLAEHAADRGRLDGARARSSPAPPAGASFRSCRLTSGSPSDGQALRDVAQQRHAARVEIEEVARPRCRRPRRERRPVGSSATACRR